MTLWSTRWKAAEKAIEEAESLESFRSDANHVMCAGICSQYRVGFQQGCTAANVPEVWWHDTLIGNPDEVINLSGIPVTGNSMRHAYHLKTLLGVWNGEGRVLEVGAGYGGLAEKICRFTNVETYYFIDGPPMLKLQEYYMSKAKWADKCVFDAPTEKADLIISINSLAEMIITDVTKYIRLFEEVLKPDTGILYLVQREKRITDWEDYPFGSMWELECTPFNPFWATGTDKVVQCFGTLKSS